MHCENSTTKSLQFFLFRTRKRAILGILQEKCVQATRMCGGGGRGEGEGVGGCDLNTKLSLK